MPSTVAILRLLERRILERASGLTCTPVAEKEETGGLVGGCFFLARVPLLRRTRKGTSFFFIEFELRRFFFNCNIRDSNGTSEPVRIIRKFELTKFELERFSVVDVC